LQFAFNNNMMSEIQLCSVCKKKFKRSKAHSCQKF